ncbi:MAG: polyprenyl synthetase family protein [Aureliella sp.]
MIDRTQRDEQAVVPVADRHQQRQFLDDLRGFLGPQLGRVEQRIQAAVATNFDFDHLSRQAAAMGGKRLRPMLVLLSAAATGNEPRAEEERDLVSIAASVELVHAASLVHDDVLDKAETRRHRATVLSQAGSKSAILLGDFLFTRAYAIAAECRSTIPARQIASAASALCVGELRQGMAAGNWSLPMAAYRQMLVQKTGSLCGTSCRLGAWRGGGSRADQRSLRRFGVLLGLAFQVFDDWLDYWGTDAAGKTLGTDLDQGKATLPVLRYLSTRPSDSEQMLELLASQQRDKLARVLERLAQTDAADFTLKTARQLATRARDSISHLPGTTARQFLQGLADFAANRQS